MSLADILKCSYGTSDFQLSDYSYKSEAILEEGKGRTGTKKTVNGKGWVEGTDAADFATKLLAVRTAFDVQGSDFRVYGLDGQIELEILAAQCQDFGPHVDFEMSEQSGGAALVKDFKFTVNARSGWTPTGGGSGGGGDTNTTTIETLPNGLRKVGKKGTLTQSGAEAIFTGTTLPALLASYPRTKWIPSVRYEANSSGTQLTYDVGFEELSSPYNTSPNFLIVSGDVNHHKDRDENHRVIRTVSFDLEVTGDYQKVLDVLRPVGKVILSEGWAVTDHLQQHLGGEFRFLESADNNDLLAWNQKIDLEDESPSLSASVVPGRAPKLYYGAQGARRAVQSGRAVGLGRWVKPPAAIWPANNTGPRKITYNKLNDAEFETTWSFEFLFSSGSPGVSATVLAELNRPTGVSFHA